LIFSLKYSNKLKIVPIIKDFLIRQMLKNLAQFLEYFMVLSISENIIFSYSFHLGLHLYLFYDEIISFQYYYFIIIKYFSNHLSINFILLCYLLFLLNLTMFFYFQMLLILFHNLLSLHYSKS
jgi:hypothetical protein